VTLQAPPYPPDGECNLYAFACPGVSVKDLILSKEDLEVSWYLAEDGRTIVEWAPYPSAASYVIYVWCATRAGRLGSPRTGMDILETTDTSLEYHLPDSNYTWAVVARSTSRRVLSVFNRTVSSSNPPALNDLVQVGQGGFSIRCLNRPRPSGRVPRG
jgi:hypothetical protein